MHLEEVIVDNADRAIAIASENKLYCKRLYGPGIFQYKTVAHDWLMGI